MHWMASALLNMGAMDEGADGQKFRCDIEQVMSDMAKVSPDVAAVGVANDWTVQAAISFDEKVMGMLLKIVAVKEDNGL